MGKHLQLTIPTPCHENWDNMNPVEKGRFCGSCQKQVVDFSNMSDRQVAQFFKKPSTGSVCGRFMQDQLDRDIAIPKKRIPWVKYFFQFVFPAFLVSMKATAQGKLKVTTTSNAAPASNCTRTVGMLVSVEKKKLKPDSLIVSSPKIKKEPVSVQEIMGDLKIEINPVIKKSLEDTITLPEVVVTSYGAVKRKISMGTTAKVVKDSIAPVSLQNGLTGTMGGIFVCRDTDIKIPKDSIVKKIFKNIIPERFKIFPNPVKSGTELHIEWKQNETGDYLLQLLNQSGQLAFTKEMWVDDEARLLDVQIPSIAAGTYFLKMINKKSGKAYTEKIVLQ